MARFFRAAARGPRERLPVVVTVWPPRDAFVDLLVDTAAPVDITADTAGHHVDGPDGRPPPQGPTGEGDPHIWPRRAPAR